MKDSEIFIPSNDIAYLKKEVEKVAVKAGDILRKYYYSKSLQIQHKGTYDLVTEADWASEKSIVHDLQKLTPQINVISEETAEKNKSVFNLKNNLYQWVVDPLDGTTNFAHHFPHFSISIALVERGQTILGIIYDPIKKELFTAQSGKGCYLNNSPCSVSSTKTLSQSLLATGFPYKIKELKKDNNLLNFCTFRFYSQGVRRVGSAALDLAYVSSGRLDGFWEQWLKPWDIAAGILMVKEANGIVSDFSGESIELNSQSIIASNGYIQKEMLNILNLPKPSLLSYLYD